MNIERNSQHAIAAATAAWAHGAAACVNFDGGYASAEVGRDSIIARVYETQPETDPIRRAIAGPVRRRLISTHYLPCPTPAVTPFWLEPGYRGARSELGT